MQSDLAKERRLLGIRAEERLKAAKEDEEECRKGHPLRRKKSEIDIANTKTLYVYARDKDGKGQKIDDKFKLYRVEVIDYVSGSYRYSSVNAKGEYKNDSIHPKGYSSGLQERWSKSLL